MHAKLETKRLLLRQLEITDWELIKFLRTDPQVNEFVDRPGADSKEAALAFINKINEGIANNQYCYWAICSLSDNETMIGSVCLWNFNETRTQAEIGFDLHPQYQGKGIMTEAVGEVLSYGFIDLGLDRIDAYTHHANVKSLNLLKRFNFVYQPEMKDSYNENNIVYILSSQEFKKR